LTFHFFASLAEFERDIIRERTKAGLEAARARGCSFFPSGCFRLFTGHKSFDDQKQVKADGVGVDAWYI
jgi:DNA invertase Pin-like site-specific DNA recombinase